MNTRLCGVSVTGLAFVVAVFAEHPAWAQTVILDQAQAWEMARQKGWVIRAETDAGVMELQAIVNGIPRYYITHNAVAADTISTGKCQPGGSSWLLLTGSGVTLGVWDGGGVRTSHQEFGGRATQVDSPGGTHSHPTHVAGTMIACGVIPSAKGMSPAADLDCYDWNSDEVEMRAAAAAGLLVSNHSYGLIAGWGFSGDWYWYGDVTVSTVEDNQFGLYTSYTQELDDIAYDHPNYLICGSAGNDRDDDGPGPGGGHYYFDPVIEDWVWSTDTRDPDGLYDCVGTEKSAKNILTVAAVEDVPGGYAGPGSVTMSSFSSWGPVDDGRIKPDISGNGVGLYSTDDLSDLSYLTLSGTSMSAPNVSGSLGLLIEHWRATHLSESDMRSSTLKGLVLHTADEVGPGNGPDYMFGWGLMNTLKAATAISLDAADPSAISELTISNGGTFELPISTDGTSSELRATICWTDPPGTPPGNLLDPPDKMLVNDLDLRIEQASPVATYYPWVLDPSDPGSAATTGDNDTDNVEQIVVYSPGVNDFTVRVTHKGVLSGGSQDFSLVVSGMVSPDVYVLTVNITGQGDVALDPLGGVYAVGTLVELTAQTAYGWAFDHWEGDLTGSDNPETVVMDEDKAVTAVFTFVGGAVIYVDADAAGNNDGSSWVDAFNDLQEALAVSVSYDQIWVAAGTYLPTSGTDRTATFQLKNGVAVYGGFDGTETLLGERAGLFDQTILSGDLGNDDVAVPCTQDLPDCDSYGGLCVEGFCIIKQNNSENSYHVVTGSGTDATAVLDGFTITAGNADGSYPHNDGGGMYSSSGAPTLTNCTFSGNSTDDQGGGMRNHNSSPTVTNCTFSRNSARPSSYAGGGGGVSNGFSSPTFVNCTFEHNSAGWGGGGMSNGLSSPVLISCTFSRNSAGSKGGGLINNNESSPLISGVTFHNNTANIGGGMMNEYDSSPSVTNCTFSGNEANHGGGMHNQGGSPTVTNCTFSANVAGRGGGVYNIGSNLALTNCTLGGNTATNNGNAMACDSYEQSYPSTVQMVNCILWDGGDEIWNNDGSTITVTYTDVQDDDPDDGVVYPGTGNIDDDPLFVDADGADDVAGTEDDNLRLGPGSPCIDTGDNTAVTVPIDLDGNIRIVDGDGDTTPTVDMGAYEFGSVPDDCNENGIPDMCDLDCSALGGDCNIPDCGLSSDNDGSGVPDECECPELAPPATPSGEPGYEKVRYISMVPGDLRWQTALRVTLTNLPAPFSAFNGTRMWVGEPREVSENAGKIDHEPGWSDFMSANLQCTPYCMDWSTAGVLHVTDDDIIPSAVYDVQAIGCGCDFDNQADYSTPLTITTSRWGDLVRNCQTCPCGAPDGEVGIVTDVTAALDKFKNLRPPDIPCEAVIKARADVEPNFPDWLVNISDVTFVLDAFRGCTFSNAPPFPFCFVW
ncbi:MAG: S8 family serine peptidase, partial [Phycisphaerales bacterium]